MSKSLLNPKFRIEPFKSAKAIAGKNRAVDLINDIVIANEMGIEDNLKMI